MGREQMDSRTNQTTDFAEQIVTHGKIKWYNANKGYGVIEPYDASRDIFFHNVFGLPPENAEPQEGQRVEYDEDMKPH